jgi:DnaJ-class molecular chaperone
MEEDFYKVLGIGRDASAADIQKAYRKLARKYHPDVNQDDAAAKEKFQKIQRAYEVLNEPEKREMYDRYGSSFESMGAGGPGARTWRTSSGGQAEFDFGQMFGEGGQAGFDFGDIFRQFGGGGPAAGTRRGRTRTQRGADLRHEIEIPFNHSILGGPAQLMMSGPDGKVEEISVKIPPGIESGKTIRLRGQGAPSPNGGTSGDLLLTVRVAPHPCFRRRGRDLEVAVPVTLAEAALGSKIDVPTPQGTITLTVPPGTSSGKRLRVRGRGVQSKDGAGDLYAEILIVVPPKLDSESEKLIRDFDARQPLSPRANLRW